MTLIYSWVGGVTDTSAWVRGKVSGTTTVRLAVSTSSDMSSPTYFTATLSLDAFSARATGLTASTGYHYAIELDGVLDSAARGAFSTFPAAGTPDTFSFWASSCASSGSNHATFDAIAAHNPDFGIHMGDLHYEDISSASQSLFRAAYDTTCALSRQHALYRGRPVAYVWDDHDFGPNNSHAGSGSKSAAQQVYRERVPHYPLAATTGYIAQTFVRGRVRFVLLDNRSARTVQSATDDASKTILGAAQKAWLKNLLLFIEEPAVCLVVGVPWIAAVEEEDHWGGYSTERAELATFLDESNLAPRVFFLHGDGHGLGIDSGANNTYAGINRPVGAFGGIDGTPNMRGDPYDIHRSAESHAFGIVEVTDAGGDITINLKARRWVSGSTDQAVASHSFEISGTPAAIVDPETGLAPVAAVAGVRRMLIG